MDKEEDIKAKEKTPETGGQEMAEMSKELEKDIETLKSEVEKLRKDIGDVTKVVSKVGRRRYDETKERTQEEIDELLDRLDEAREEVRGRSVNAARRARGEIEEHPMTSILVALGIGAFVGSILSIRR